MTARSLKPSLSFCTRILFAIVTAIAALAPATAWAQGRDHLGPNDTMTNGQWLNSPNGRYELAYADGNLVLRVEGIVKWQSFTDRVGVLVMQNTDGNLVAYDGADVVWASNTGAEENANSTLYLENTGDLVVRRPDMSKVASVSNTEGEEPPAGWLGTGGYIDPGEERQGPSGYRLVNQASDGNIVLYTSDYSDYRWDIHDIPGPGGRLRMQDDGNLVLGDGSRFNSGTQGNPGAHLEIRDGYIAIYTTDGQEIWRRPQVGTPTTSFHLTINGQTAGGHTDIRKDRAFDVQIVGDAPYPNGYVRVQNNATGAHPPDYPLTGQSNESVFVYPLQPGDYSVWAYFTGVNGGGPYENGPGVTISQPFLTVNGSSGGLAINALTKLNVEVNNNPVPEAGDWIGLFEFSAPDGSEPLDWKYANNSRSIPPDGIPNGSVEFDAPYTRGFYEVRFFTTNSTIPFVKSAPFQVVWPQPSLTIRGYGPTDQVNVKQNELFWIDVKWPNDPNDYLMFWSDAGADIQGPRPLVANADYTYSQYFVANPSQSNVFHVYLIDGTTGEIEAQSPPINVYKAFLSINGQIEGGSITIPINTFIYDVWVAGASGSTTDWFGFYKKTSLDHQWIEWWYLNCSHNAPSSAITDGAIPPPGSGCSPLMKTDDENGEYELRLFANDGFLLLTKGPKIIVTGGTPKVTITDNNGIKHRQGENVDVSTLYNPFEVYAYNGPGIKGDFVGIYEVGAPATSPLDWKFLKTRDQSAQQGPTAPKSGFVPLARPTISQNPFEVRFYSAGDDPYDPRTNATLLAYGPRIVGDPAKPRITLKIKSQESGSVQADPGDSLPVEVIGQVLAGDRLIFENNAGQAHAIDQAIDPNGPFTFNVVAPAIGIYSTSVSNLSLGQTFSGPVVSVGKTGVDTTFYYDTDALGSLRLVTDASGAEVARKNYLPFGSQWNSTGTSDRIGFAGKERDSETRQNYFGARYFSSDTGRMTQPDPVRISAARLLDPQQFLLYPYARNNPLRFIDPLGRELTVTGNWDAVRAALCGILDVPVSECQDRVKMDPKTRVVSVDFDGIGLARNTGAQLIRDVINSRFRYDVSFSPVYFAADGLHVNAGGVSNLDNRKDYWQPTGKYNKPGLWPPVQFDDQITIDPAFFGTHPNVVPYTLLFHELAEAFIKVDYAIPRGADAAANGAGAHTIALEMENDLRGERPYLFNFPFGGVPAAPVPIFQPPGAPRFR